MKEELIIQFAKWPVQGKVKTRLAKSLGESRALNVHILLMNEVLDNLIAYDPENLELWFDDMPGAQVNMTSTLEKIETLNIPCKIQCGINLGDKMAHALSTSLKQFRKVIIVGSDCPDVSKRTLAKAMEALEINDLVLGPAEDGGYVLIGAKRFDAAVFDDVAWGTDSVLAETIANIELNNYSCSLLEESWDVDELADYERWLKTVKKQNKP